MLMYPYLVMIVKNRYVIVINSEENPLKSYTVRITVDNNKIVKCSCECKGFAIRGKCKHIALAKNKIAKFIK
ncbi:MAG: SWIM zinc finger family protein [Saccharolobus sp.]